MAKKGILLINLGSPDAPTTPAVRRYLHEFLSDPYVIDIPTPFRQLLVYGVIGWSRAPKSAHAYRQVWRDEGSPLKYFTESFAGKIRSKHEVRWAMRYGNPSLKSVCKKWDVDEVLIVPLYPQYAESSTRTAVEEAQKHLKMKTKVLPPFYDREEFLSSQAERIQKELDTWPADYLLMSFHGLPEHHIAKLPPELNYRTQCFDTMESLKKKLKFPSEKVGIGFQSRLGRRPWIKPYSDFVVEELAQKGVRRLAVTTPSFVADCLETLEEVQMRLKEQFQEAGGEDLRLIPALNDDDVWAQRFTRLLEREI